MTGGWELLTRLRPELDTARFDLFVDELLHWNQTIRLVGPKDVKGIRLQIVDALLPYLYCEPTFALLDIGSGAGLPAIPLAIAFPGSAITALEPHGKRVSFMRHAARTLGLQDFKVVQARAGETGEAHPELSSAFSCVTARAVSDVATLLGWAQNYLAPGGKVVLGRGEEGAVELPGWQLAEQKEYAGPEGLGRRSVHVYLPEN